VGEELPIILALTGQIVINTDWGSHHPAGIAGIGLRRSSRGAASGV
jgi:hypothetical protein